MGFIQWITDAPNRRKPGVDLINRLFGSSSKVEPKEDKKSMNKPVIFNVYIDNKEEKTTMIKEEIR
jgi:hypothetical protein